MADFDRKKIKLVIGLGNPGKEYENTYHNTGHLFVEYLLNGKWQIAHGKLLKSNAYMNASGAFVKKAIKKHDVKPEELIIAHDDSDIELGKFKLSFGRGSAGHKGVESVAKSLGTKNFWRLRIGIRRDFIRPIGRISPIRHMNIHQKTTMPPQAQRVKAGDFVLKKMSAGDKKTLEGVFRTIAERLSQ